MSNSTLSGNGASFNGGIDLRGSGEINNTIIAGNTNNDGSIAFDILGIFSSGSNNLIGTGGSGGLTDGTDGNIVGVMDIATVLNTTLAANGTTIFAGDPNAPGGQEPILTHALVPGSQAINAGSNALAVDVDENPLTTDQRGLPRVVNTTVDIGAFEAQ